MDPTRYAIAKSGLEAAVSDNAGSIMPLGPDQAAADQSPNGASRRTATSLFASPTPRRARSATRPPATSAASWQIRHLRARASARRTLRSSCLAEPDDGARRPTIRPASVLTVVRKSDGDAAGLVPAEHGGTSATKIVRLTYALVDAKTRGDRGDDRRLCDGPRSAATPSSSSSRAARMTGPRRIRATHDADRYSADVRDASTSERRDQTDSRSMSLA